MTNMNTAFACGDDWDDKCFICLGNYKNPKMLPCSHSFCENPCTQFLLNSAIGNTFRCPLCQQEFVVPTTGTNAFVYNTNFLIIPRTELIQNPVSNNRTYIRRASPGDGTDNNCSICLEHFKSPKILPCTHNICEKPCLHDLLNSANGDTFRCPLCRLEFPVPPNGTTAFPSNTNLHHSSAIQTPQNPQSNNRTNTKCTCSALVSDEPDTRCFICSSSFRNPKILPCTHNFCEEPCLQSLLNSTDGNTFRCPLCRLEFPVPPNGTTAFPSNTNFHQISAIQTDQNPQSNNRNTTCSALVREGSETQCSICLSNFRNPKILPCTHNFCEEPCLQGLLNSAGGNTFRCPSCRQEFPVPSTGTRAFPYNRNFQTIFPTRTEIPIRSPLVRFHHNYSRNAQANQRAVPGIHLPVDEIRHPRLPPESHVTATTSCCRPLSCTELMKKMCVVAFIVHYVGASLARIGIISYLFLDGTVTYIHYFQLAQCIINILTALATFRRKYTVAKVLSWIVFVIFLYGLSVFTTEWECKQGVENCYDFVVAARFFYICDLIMFFFFIIFLCEKTDSCCCCCCCY